METIDNLVAGADDVEGLVELAVEAEDKRPSRSRAEVDGLVAQLEKLNSAVCFSGDQDANDAYIDLQSGSGGTGSTRLVQYVAAHVLALGRGERL